MRLKNNKSKGRISGRAMKETDINQSRQEGTKDAIFPKSYKDPKTLTLLQVAFATVFIHSVNIY